MLKNWPLLFIAIPVAEIYLFIEIGGRIGSLWTVMLVIATAVIGVNLLRFQGMATLNRAQQSMKQGKLPAMEMMEGLCLAIGGALLITPGFLTDSLGFICLLPITRRAIIRYIMANATIKMSGMHTRQGFNASSVENQAHNKVDDSAESRPKSGRPNNASSGRTYEGEYTREDD